MWVFAPDREWRAQGYVLYSADLSFNIRGHIWGQVLRNALLGFQARAPLRLLVRVMFGIHGFGNTLGFRVSTRCTVCVSNAFRKGLRGLSVDAGGTSQRIIQRSRTQFRAYTGSLHSLARAKHSAAEVSWFESKVYGYMICGSYAEYCHRNRH